MFQPPGMVFRPLQHGAVHHHAPVFVVCRWSPHISQLHHYHWHQQTAHSHSICCRHLPGTLKGFIPEEYMSVRSADDLPGDTLWQFVQEFFGYANNIRDCSSEVNFQSQCNRSSQHSSLFNQPSGGWIIIATVEALSNMDYIKFVLKNLREINLKSLKSLSSSC